MRTSKLGFIEEPCNYFGKSFRPVGAGHLRHESNETRSCVQTKTRHKSRTLFPPSQRRGSRHSPPPLSPHAPFLHARAVAGCGSIMRYIIFHSSEKGQPANNHLFGSFRAVNHRCMCGKCDQHHVTLYRTLLAPQQGPRPARQEKKVEGDE